MRNVQPGRAPRVERPWYHGHEPDPLVRPAAAPAGIGTWAPRALLEAHRASMVQLGEQFAAIERSSLTLLSAPLGTYLCCRVDGIKVSKRYLSDKLSYPAFSAALHAAVETVYHLFRRCIGEEHGAREEGNFFLGMIAVSDEVSFILNNRRNFLDNRVCKTVTTLASTLSAAMSLSFAAESAKTARPTARGNQWPQVIAFDGRPLVLTVQTQLEDYLRHRWLLSARNAMCKVLRVQRCVSERDLYDTDLKDNVPELVHLVERYGLREPCAELMSEFTLFLPEQPNAEAKLVAFSTPPGFGEEALALHRKRLMEMAGRLSSI